MSWNLELLSGIRVGRFHFAAVIVCRDGLCLVVTTVFARCGCRFMGGSFWIGTSKVDSEISRFRDSKTGTLTFQGCNSRRFQNSKIPGLQDSSALKPQNSSGSRFRNTNIPKFPDYKSLEHLRLL